MRKCVKLKSKGGGGLSNFDYSFFAENTFYKHERTLLPDPLAYTEHTHSMYEILYFVSGDATFMTEGRRYKLMRGDLVLVRPMRYHILKIDKPIEYERYDILFNNQVTGFDISEIIPDGIDVINLSANPMAEGIFKRLDYYKENLSDDRFACVLAAMMRELFLNLSIAPEKLARSDYQASSALICRALEIINERIFSIKSVSEVARELFVSEGYLFEKFKKEMGSTPKKYINSKRLLAARSLICQGEMPTEIYEKCGFRDYTSFYRGYVKYFGCAPSHENKTSKKGEYLE